MSKTDLVDVHVSSTKPIVDVILEHPILDGTKKYSVEVTEFAMPLSSEGPLPSNSVFTSAGDNMLLFRVRRKLIGTAPIHNNTLLSTTPVIGASFDETFVPNSFRPIRTPNDLVFYLQEYFDAIKRIYANWRSWSWCSRHTPGRYACRQFCESIAHSQWHNPILL